MFIKKRQSTGNFVCLLWYFIVRSEHFQDCLKVVGVKRHINSYGHITARARLVTYSVFDDRIYEMIGETRHRDHYPTLFKRWQGIFYVQCPIDRAPHTMAFVNPVMLPQGKELQLFCGRIYEKIRRNLPTASLRYSVARDLLHAISTGWTSHTQTLVTLVGAQGDRDPRWTE